MEKDLVIGVFSNYGYDVVKPWIKSIKETGFKGDVVLIGINISEITSQEITNDGVTCIMSKPSSKNSMIHMERFFHIYDYLKNKDYRFVVSTDVRDVIFQRNPSEWLENHLENSPHSIVSASEAIQIKNEDWNKNNIVKNFGQYFYDDVKDEEVQNVGILAGLGSVIKDLSFHLYQMSLNRTDWVADQAAYNMMVHFEPYKSLTLFSKLKDAWAINAHVTNYEPDMIKFEPHLLEKRPIFENGQVLNSNREPFCVIHQYDRVVEWKKFYETKYGVKINSQYTPDDTDDEIITISTGG